MSNSLCTQSIDPQTCHFDIRRIELMLSYTEPRRLPQIFKQRQLELKKFLKADFPRKVIENTINNFSNVDEELMIPRWFFDLRKTVVINLPFSNKNEHFWETFWKKLEYYSNGKIKFNIIWAKKKIKLLFKIKVLCYLQF